LPGRSWISAKKTSDHLSARRFIRPTLYKFPEADSWALHAHKWLNVPYDSGVAFVRVREALGRAMSISGAYLLSPAVTAML
jgi:glutamate/tyrosine decarboxylase-like PLP-dependent enzyme